MSTKPKLHPLQQSGHTTAAERSGCEPHALCRVEYHGVFAVASHALTTAKACLLNFGACTLFVVGAVLCALFGGDGIWSMFAQQRVCGLMKRGLHPLATVEF
jgi:hypothetical protein